MEELRSDGVHHRYNRDDKIERNPAIIHETSRYASLARLVADLAEQWLEEEEARVTGFTVAGFSTWPPSRYRAGKETTFVERNTPDVTIRESWNRLVGRDESLLFRRIARRSDKSLRTLESGTQSFGETFLFHES